MSHPKPGDVYQLTTNKYRWPRDLTTVTDDIGTRYTVIQLSERKSGEKWWETRRSDGTRAYWDEALLGRCSDFALISPSD